MTAPNVSSDPSPPDAELACKRYDRMRAIAPTLIGSLIRGHAIPDDLTPSQPARPLPKRDAAQREVHRAKEARRRERIRARNAEAARVLAAQIEARHEDLAPAVLRNPVMAPDGAMLRGPRINIIDGRPRLSNPVLAMRTLSVEQKRAAARLQADWREAGDAPGLGASDYGSAGGRGDGTGRHDAMMAQCDARDRLCAALAHLGAFVPLVTRVVLHCVPLAVWATESRLESGEALGWLRAALDRLVSFGRPKRRQGADVGILVIGPARAAYSVGIVEVDAVAA